MVIPTAIMVRGIAPGRVRTTNDVAVPQHDGHTPGNRFTEAFSLGLWRTSLIFDLSYGQLTPAKTRHSLISIVTISWAQALAFDLIGAQLLSLAKSIDYHTRGMYAHLFGWFYFVN